MGMPRAIIIAGPNGAGKTTFARSFVPHEGGLVDFVNADLIAAGLSPFAPEAAAIRAGRIMLAEIRRLVAERADFAFETTLSGRAYARMIPTWQDDGYRVELIFLKLNSIRLANARVRQRVKQGGHFVSPKIVSRRFRAGWSNFNSLYRPLVNAWRLYDNSGTSAKLIAEGANT
jgi:predicted ABC-type ATPase